MISSDSIILLVEDNQDDEVLTLRALHKNHILNQVVVVRDGLEAIDYLFGTGSFSGRNTEIQPQLILLDLNLPKLNGVEVLKRIRSDPRTKLQPVVILTTSNEDQDIFDSYEYGANSFIRKPVSFDQFMDAIRQLGLYWLVLNTPTSKTGGHRQ